MSAGVRWAADSSKARRELGWQPRPLAEGLKSMAYEGCWPAYSTTWLNYFRVGRWNYLKGLTVAALLAVIVFLFRGLAPALILFALAPLYVALSGLGLYVLYGHPTAGYLNRLYRLAGLKGNERIADVHFGTYRGTRRRWSFCPAAG